MSAGAAAPETLGARLWRVALAAAPIVTAAILLGPILIGVLFTLLPAFGYLPALGGDRLSLASWRALLAEPQLPGALLLSLKTGMAATAISTFLALGFCAAAEGSRLMAGIGRLLAPVLALPHLALAIGFAFLAAPSGWIARAISPWATGWQQPPDLATAPDPYGIALILGLVMKETPFLLLMALAARAEIAPARWLLVGRTLGYAPLTAWTKLILPRLYPLIRLPIYAVLVFSLSVVDMALVLAPTHPPPLSVLALRLFADPDLTQRFAASAAAILQLAVALAAIALWHGGAKILALWARPYLSDGARGRAHPVLGVALRWIPIALLAIGALAFLAMALWSVADSWRFPALWPEALTLDRWRGLVPTLLEPFFTTLALGLGATAIALVLALGCLEAGARSRPQSWLRGAIYLPLLMPQIGFLFGTQILFVALSIGQGWIAVLLAHLIFVLPYVFLSLSESWRRFDPRYRWAAASLGASPPRQFFEIVLPLLKGPVAAALAIGFAVSVGQYLATLFPGGGRIATLTTEAVAIAGGGDRRHLAIHALLQALLPLLGFFMAAHIGAAARNRKGGRA